MITFLFSLFWLSVEMILSVIFGLKMQQQSCKLFLGNSLNPNKLNKKKNKKKTTTEVH